MFCEKCGRPVEDDQTICSACAAEQSAVICEEPAVEEIPVCGTLELGAVDAAPAPKAPKKKKGLIAAIAALAVAAAAAIGIFLNMDSINGFVGRTFQSPEEYLADVESAAITEYSADITEVYGAFLKNYAANLTAGSAEVRLTLGEDLLSYAESMLQQQGAQFELDWLSQIRLFVNANVQETAMQMGLGLGLGDTDLLSADMILDMDKNTLYLTIPDVNKNYLSGDLSSQVAPGAIKDAFSQGMQMSNALIKALPTEEQVNKLITTYVDIILSEIDSVEKENDTVTVNDISQDMVVLTAKITQEDLLDIAEKVLKKAEKDQNLKDILTALGNYVNEIGAANSYADYYEPIDVYQEFVSAIPSALADIEAAKEDTDDGNYIKLKVYVDMKNNVRGHAVNIYADGEKQEEPSFNWLSVVKGDTTYTKAELPQIGITGEETEEKGVSKGEYTLSVEGQKVGTLEFEDVTENGGTLRLVPSDELLNQALSGSGIPASLLSGNLALELSYNTRDGQSGIEVNILAGPKALIGLGLTAKASQGGAISIPSNALDATNQDNLMQWVQGADLSGVLKALETAKVPTELIDIVRGYANMLQGN